jgi:O-antigen ligase
MHKAYPRPHGFSTHPILFAADLAFVCGSSLIMLLIGHDVFADRKEKYFLIIVAVLTFISIVLSQSRGVWIALFAACPAVIFLYNRKKALIFFLSLTAIIILLLSVSGNIRQRALSIVTSIYTEDEKGDTGNRLELWKGALVIFKEHPLLGTGYGDFQGDIKSLIVENKLKDMPVTLYAHNIFLQALATRGIIGFVILLSLFASLVVWGIKKAGSDSDTIGGYIILLSTLLTIIGGLTENNIEIHRFLAAYSFTVGLIGPYRSTDVRKTVAHNS